MMREKRRYILVRTTIDVHDDIRNEFERELFKELVHHIGEDSYFLAHPKVIRYIGMNKFILKCNLSKYRETIIALTFIKRINGKDVGFYTLNASGTIDALLKPKKKQA